MKTFLTRLFIDNWSRKCLSLLIATMIWFGINKSLVTTRTIHNVAVKVANVPKGKIVEGLQSSGFLNRRIHLTLTGNRTTLRELNTDNFHIILDAKEKSDEWIAPVTVKNLCCNNPHLAKGLHKVSYQNFIVKLNPLVTERIPITVDEPIGQCPEGYQFNAIWPKKLYTTLSGPEEIIRKIKQQGIKLTFNLYDISKYHLDSLRNDSDNTCKDIVSFSVPSHWKYTYTPSLSVEPSEINDPNAQDLRIDFLYSEFLKIDQSIPISLYFPPNKKPHLSPQNVTVIPNHLIENFNGVKLISKQLYAKGVSHLFLDIVKNHLHISVVMPSKGNNNEISWSIQCVDEKKLEDLFVQTLMNDSLTGPTREIFPQKKTHAAYLRDRFRHYMRNIELFDDQKQPFNFNFELKGHSVFMCEVEKNEV